MFRLLPLILLLPALAWATSFSAPVFTGMPLAPELRDDLLSTLPSNGDDKDDAKEKLESLMAKLKNPKTPVFIDPTTGRPILVNELEPKKPSAIPGIGSNNPDALTGCVTHTSCHGEGKDKECDTWEVCVSSN